jgi:hypothetical protein
MTRTSRYASRWPLRRVRVSGKRGLRAPGQGALRGSHGDVDGLALVDGTPARAKEQLFDAQPVRLPRDAPTASARPVPRRFGARRARTHDLAGLPPGRVAVVDDDVLGHLGRLLDGETRRLEASGAKWQAALIQG